MSSSQSLWPSHKPSTTALDRRRLRWRGARGRRERCKKRTTLHGARRHLSRGCGPESRWTRGPPGDEAVAVGYAAASVPVLGAPSLADSSAEATDGSTLSFLQQHALDDKRKEEEEAVETAELAKLEEKVAAAEVRLLHALQQDRLRALHARDEPGCLSRSCASFFRSLSYDWESSFFTCPCCISAMKTSLCSASCMSSRFLMDDYEELIPKWFYFVGGVVSEDLPLNISRERLRHMTCTFLLKKCLEMFAETPRRWTTTRVL